MGKSVYKKLVLTALVTSIAFGGFAALNYYIFRELNPVLSDQKFVVIRPKGQVFKKSLESGAIPGQISLPGPSPVNNSLYTMAGMLFVWSLNIGILLVVEKLNIHAQKRALTRYIGSYAAITLVIIAYMAFNPPNASFKTFRAPGPSPGHEVNRTTMTGLAPVDLMDEVHLPDSVGPYLKSSNVSRTFKVGFHGRIPFMTAMILNTIVIAILELILLQHHKSQVDLENTQLKMSHLLARHQHLKHQLHPHFLFNSLNTLKSLIKKSPLEAEKYLLRLSGFLRSSLTRNDLDIISLEDELQLCMDYMDMQKIRFGDAFHYTVDMAKATIESVSVPAFSIQLLIENAIKHNALTKEYPLSIRIDYLNDGYIQVKNNKRLKNLHEPSASIGLKNLAERYKMISGDDIKIIESESEFIVQIQALKE